MRPELEFTNGEKIELGTMYCIGRNYAKHALEMGATVPEDPIVFLKPPAAYLPDGGEIQLPSYSNEVHHEVELVVVIGKEARGTIVEPVENYIAGYGVGIDLTLRDVQAKCKANGHPWAVAKGFVTSAPISKIVPAGEVGSSDTIFNLELKVNGELRQAGSTDYMERSVETLVKYLAEVFTLQPGDIIFTGTPEGVAEVKSGDTVTAELKGYVGLQVSAKK